MGRLPKILVVSMALCLFTAGALAAPVISDVEVSRLYGTSATVTWTTNTASTSRVYYGTSTPPASYVSSSELVTSHSITLTGLSTCTTYYFSVMSTDGGGSTTDNNGGAYYTFATGLDTQIDYDSTDVPKTIPLNGSVTSTITVTDNKTIEDINVTIGSVLQTNVYTLSLCLIAPDATCIPLSLNNGDPEEQDYYQTVLDDEAALYIGDTSQSPPYTGVFIPNGQLGHLKGKNASGIWTLEAENVDNTSDGSLESWGLSFSYPYKYCTSHLSVTGYTVVDDVCTGIGAGGDNGVVDPGEEITLQVTLYNDGNADQTSINGTLTTSTAGVTVNDGSASFPDTAMENSGSSLSNHFKFTVSDITLECATEIEFTLHIASSQKPTGWNETFIVPIGNQTSPGGTVLDEDFTFGIPATWTIVNGGTGGEGPPDASTWTSSNPCLAPNDPPLNAPVAQVDSFCAGEEATQDEQLITPVLNLSAADEVTLDFDEGFFYWYDNSTYEIGDVDIKSSLTSGSWVNILRNDYTTCYYGCIGSPSLDITDYAAGASNVQIRFHYYAAAYDNAWVIDNVRVTYTIDPQCSMNRCCPDMTEPVIGTISDLDLCDQDGISIPFTQGSPATRHDLYVDGTLEVSGVTSPVFFDPGDESSHSYVVRAVNYFDDCFIDSSASSFTDEDQTPSTPSITNITDDDACAQSGIKVYYTAGSPATSTKLVVDSVEVATMTGSPYSYNPGNTTSHTYIVRTYNNTCHNDSTSQAFSDANVKPGAPTITGITDVSVCAQSGIKVNFNPGTPAGTSYNLLRDDTVVVTGYTSGATYNPGNTTSYTYKVRAVVGTCTTDSTGSSFADANNTPGPPSITGITDVDLCAQSGIQVAFNPGTPAGSSYNLLRNDTVVVTGYTSGTTYNPGSTTSYTYKVQAVVGTCTNDSTGSAFADANNTPGAPNITGITDVNVCAQSGIQVAFTPGTPAGSSYNLLRDGTVVVTGYTSGATYNPGDTSSHTYKVRAVVGACTTDSTGSSFADANNTPGSPSITGITDADLCAQNGIKVSFNPGTPAGSSYNLLRNDTVVVTGYTSGATYNPGSTSSYTYKVQAVVGTCTADSTGSPFSDANNTPGAPNITGITDVNVCAQSGIQVAFTAGTPPGSSYNLLKDGVIAAIGYTSGTAYDPGDTSSHTYIVQAVVGSCTTNSSGSAFADANNSVSAPAAPTVVDVAACALTGVSISWGAVSGATAYDLLEGSTNIISGVSSPYTYQPGDTANHVYRIRARNASCTSGWSSYTIGKDENNSVTEPSAPTVVDVEGCALSGVTISWGAVSGATGYDLLEGSTNVISDVTSPYVYAPGDTDNHVYRIRAKNAFCTSGWSAYTIGKDVNNGVSAPGAPGVVDINACTQSGVTVSWTAVSGATGYDLYFDSTTIVSDVTSPHTYNPGNTSSHNYQIRAKNASCTGSWSTATAGTDANGTPSQPSITNITDNDPGALTGITITYTAGSPATQHDLYKDGSLATPNFASGSTYLPGDSSQHMYKIKAVNGSCTTDSTSVAGTDSECTDPSAPVISSVTDASACAQSGVTVTFTTGAPATQHDLYVDGSLAQANVTSPHLYSPSNTSSHAYVIRAVNGSCHTDSNTVNASDVNDSITAPTISSVTDVAVCLTNGVTVSWGAVSGATGYDLRFNGTTIVTDVTSPHVYEPGDNSAHNYEVRSKNASCTSGWSTPYSGTDLNSTPAAPTISAVTDIAPCATSGVTISWGTVSGATGYDLRYNGVTVVTGVTSPSTYYPGDNSAHNYEIRAKNASCTGSWSAPVAGTDLNESVSAPSAPTVVDVDPCALSGVSISWTAVPGATRYDLLEGSTNVTSNVTSPYIYHPVDSDNHVYRIMAKSDHCSSAWSAYTIGKDANGTTPSQPVIASVTDNNPLVLDGVVITFTAGSPATSSNLWMDGAQVATGITSPYLYTPGDSSPHSYVVRTVNGACYSDSVAVLGSDLAGCTAPSQEVTDDKPPAGDKTQFSWTAVTADNYRVVRGLNADLANLLSASADFSCYAFGSSTSVNISADDPGGESGRCYYYLVQAYNGTDPDLCVGPAGNATGGARQVETPAACN